MTNQNPISAFLEPIISKCFNKYTGVHFGANLLIVFTLSRFFDNWTSAIATLSIAMLWELYEYMTEGFKPYGSTKNWRFDTSMDLVVSVLCIGFVLL